MARTLNGTSDYMVGEFAAMGAAGTFAFWVKKSVADVEAGGVFHYLFDNNAAGRTLMYKNPDGGLTWWVGGNSVFDDTVSSKSIITGTDWQHVALTWDNSLGSNKNAVYRNGSLLFNTNVTVTTSGTTTHYFGVRNSLTQFFWAGALAEWCQWSAALTGNELAALAAGCSPLMVRPGTLQRYLPLLGNSPEPSYTGGGGSATLTGTTITAHPATASLTAVGVGYDPAPDIPFTGPQSTSPGFISATTTVYQPSFATFVDAPFIAAATTAFAATLVAGPATVTVPFLTATTTLYAPTLPRVVVPPHGISISFNDRTLEPDPFWIRLDI